MSVGVFLGAFAESAKSWNNVSCKRPFGSSGVRELLGIFTGLFEDATDIHNPSHQGSMPVQTLPEVSHLQEDELSHGVIPRLVVLEPLMRGSHSESRAGRQVT